MDLRRQKMLPCRSGTSCVEHQWVMRRVQGCKIHHRVRVVRRSRSIGTVCENPGNDESRNLRRRHQTDYQAAGFPNRGVEFRREDQCRNVQMRRQSWLGKSRDRSALLRGSESVAVRVVARRRFQDQVHVGRCLEQMKGEPPRLRSGGEYRLPWRDTQARVRASGIHC